MQEFLTSALENWAALYSNHAALRTAVEFLHIGGLVVSGGIAITTDRAILLARRGDADRSLQIRNVQTTHLVVAIGLFIVIVSGLFLLAADTGTYLHSLVFWSKMACFGLLLINGLLLRQAGRSAGSGDPKAWGRLRATSAVSITFWLLTTLLGSALPNIS
jgi:hypothetical protein